jgi:hypothetical protein
MKRLIYITNFASFSRNNILLFPYLTQDMMLSKI